MLLLDEAPTTTPPQPAPEPAGPFLAGAPWPVMRGDLAGTGRSLAPAVPAPGGPGPRRFRTGNAVFSTPVIGPGERLYVGSADHHVYCLDPLAPAPAGGDPEALAEVWRVCTGEVIDSAACLTACGAVVVPSGDGCLHALELDGRPRWRFDALTQRAGRPTPSTIFWWEGNVTVGPSGLVYAGCDDFWLYALDPRDGAVRWARPTGLHIWSAPAFARGLVLAASFDLRLHAFDHETGAPRWTADLENFAAASPAVGPDGRAYLGGFDGVLRGFELERGRRTLRLDLGAPLYGSAAVAPDGLLVVGGLDGVVHGVDPARGRVVWSFATGDAVRGSAAIGPDPEGRAPWLAYVPSGDGCVHALEPDGRRRWALALARDPDYPDVNASVALGRHGLATATAGGEVVWVPYDHVLRAPEAYAHGAPAPARGRWRVASRGGRPGPALGAGAPEAASEAAPASPAAPLVVEVEPHEPLHLRRAPGAGGATPTAARVDVREGRFPHALRVLPGGRDLVLAPAPDDPCPLGPEGALLALGAAGPGDGPGEASGPPALVRLVPRPAPEGAPASVAGLSFRVARMSLPVPAIVPTFDQIGLASLAIDVRVVDHDPVTGAVLAWGVQEFGLDAAGGLVGVPLARRHLFAFGGRYERGRLVLEAGPGRFEITAFALPTERLRLAATLDDSGLPAVAPSLLLEAAAPSLGALLPQLTAGPARWGALPGQLLAARRTLPALWRLLRGRLHRPWGLVDDAGGFVGLGTFRAAPAPARADAPLALAASPRDDRRGVAVAFAPGTDPRARPGLLVVDATTGRPVATDPNALAVRRGRDGAPREARLPLPAEVRGRPLRVLVLSGLTPVAEARLP